MYVMTLANRILLLVSLSVTALSTTACADSIEDPPVSEATGALGQQRASPLVCEIGPVFGPLRTTLELDSSSGRIFDEEVFELPSLPGGESVLVLLNPAKRTLKIDVQGTGSDASLVAEGTFERAVLQRKAKGSAANDPTKSFRIVCTVKA